MDIPFVYYKNVTGKNFIGRTTDLNIFCNLLSQGENIVIYEPPKTGKNSLIQQAAFNMSSRQIQMMNAEFSLLNSRTIADVMMGIGSSILIHGGKNPDEYALCVEKYLTGTHFTFDPEVFSAKGRIISLNWDIDEEDIRAILTLPYRFAQDRGIRLTVLLSDFQNILETEDGELFCNMLQDVFKSLTPQEKQCASYIFCGSGVNAMKYIFERRKFFYRQVERVSLSTIDTKDIVENCVRNFLAGGKVLDRDLMLGVCKLFRNNIWYINHFCAICDSFSKGYIMEPVLVEALNALISIHEPRFKAMMNDLTTFQICLLRAILDGHTRFSSADVIRRYNLHSSANVLRLKDALCKKEIITFDQDDMPVILDPLFEYWVGKYFFEIETSL